MYVHRPIYSGGEWLVLITEDKSVCSKVIERAKFYSGEKAFQYYRHIMKEMGFGL